MTPPPAQLARPNKSPSPKPDPIYALPKRTPDSSSSLSKPKLRLNLDKVPPQESPSLSTIAALTASTPASATAKESSSSNQPYSQPADYFSLPPSEQPHQNSLVLLLSLALRLRLSLVSTPHEMVDLVRNSINSKAKAGAAKEARRKNQEVLAGFRNSIEKKRITTQIGLQPALMVSPLIDDTLHSIRLRSSARLKTNVTISSSLASLASSSAVLNNSFNDSAASLPVSGSADDWYQERDLNPYDSDASNSAAPSIRVTDHANDYADETLKKPPTPSKAIPIKVPLSPHARAREEAITGSLESLALHNPIPEIPRAEDAVKKTARRKPPPEFSDSEEMASQQEYMEPMGRSSFLSSRDDASDSVKFPVFPEIPEKSHKHRGIFGRRKDKLRNPVSDSYLTLDSDADLSVSPDVTSPSQSQSNNSPQRPVAASQPVVSLKTTMRKWDKRKNKKTAFNEDKPWKNHLALDAVLDTERKRYEGLWASNKGLYMDRVVTRLHGVDYSKSGAGSRDDKSNGDISEVLEIAAKLSAEALASTNMEDHLKERHGLNHADPHDLIHGAVVKRIWSRSRLPRETLEQIWDLVDFRKDGTLNKPEFIVGMWLVDQCLYGRKLPKKVEESVWASLGNLGVNVVIKKKRR